VADAALVRRTAGRLALEERWWLFVLIGVQGAATAAGLVGPAILGGLVNQLAAHRETARGIVVAVAVFGVALCCQAVLTRLARSRSAVLGERILARLREGLVDGVLSLPLGVVERAGTGDLLTRSTTDVELLTTAVQRAVPDMGIAAVTATLTVVALVVSAPPMALVLLPAIPPLFLINRWYLRRASAAYLNRQAALAQVNSRLQETMTAGRTIEAFNLGERRRARIEEDIRSSLRADWATFRLRVVLFPTTEACYILPLFTALLAGGLFHVAGILSLGAVTTAALYAQQLVGPVDILLSWLAALQIGGASMARILGVGQVPQPEVTADEPRSDRLVARDVHFAYRRGRDVLRGLDLSPEPGRRLAVIGPSGAGKTTLALLLAGVFAPGSGTVRVGGVEVSKIPTERLRAEVALVTQEQHVFAASLRDNLLISDASADDGALWEVLDEVDLGAWARALPQGLDTPLGSGGLVIGPAQSQQLALARLLLANPHTLVLDEATSLLDPGAARHLERSLGRVLAGRTVVTIAHRLEAARDADMVAVVDAGRVLELGTHAELLAAQGSYASLWRAWTRDSAASRG
jgi:ABC-type multidrug transport system fused ATPase/permease subunit